MNIEKLKEVIAKSDLTEREKLIYTGLIERANSIEQKDNEDIQLIEPLINGHKVDTVLLSTETFKIFKIKEKKNDDWSVKYPYRCSIFKNDTWRVSHMVNASLDEAMLNILAYYHLGSNSEFVTFAMKMLGIKEPE